MTIPFRIKLLTPTAKAPEMANEGDLWDIFADGFCTKQYMKLQEVKGSEIDKCDWDNPVVFAEELAIIKREKQEFFSVDFEEDLIMGLDDVDTLHCFQDTLLTKYEMNNEEVVLHPQGRILVKTGIALELPKQYDVSVTNTRRLAEKWFYNKPKSDIGFFNLKAYAVADLRPRSGLALKHGITVLNAPATIDNSYRKEIGVILYNAGHEPYTINKGDKICQMLIRPLYPSKIEIVDNVEDTGRGGYGSTDK